MKIKTIFVVLSKLKFLAILLAGLFLTTSALALTTSFAGYDFCENDSVVCVIKNSKSVGMAMDGLSYLAEFDNMVEPNISDAGFACETMTHRLTGEAEWSAFLSDLRHGNVLNVAWKNQKSDLSVNGNCKLGEVPTSSASWLFATVLVGFVGLSNKRRV